MSSKNILMLLVKKVISNCIDFIFFALMSIFLDWMWNKIGINEQNHFFIFGLSFVTTIIFPILICSRTLGQLLIGVKYASIDRQFLKISLILKSCLFYFIIPFSSLNLLSIIS